MVVIETYRFGKITIGGKIYTKDLIICPNGVFENWWRKEGHSLHVEDLDLVAELKPEILVIGTGFYDVLRVPDMTRDWLSRKRIELIASPTKEACQRYNDLADSANVAAGLHLTC